MSLRRNKNETLTKSNNISLLGLGMAALAVASPLIVQPQLVRADGYSYDSPHLSREFRSSKSQTEQRNYTEQRSYGEEFDSNAASLESAAARSEVLNKKASYAGSERREAALAHYARARSMLLESLAEFERAREIARPDLIIDTENWRSTVVSRARELDKVLEPKPRTSESGVRLSDQPTLLREEAAGGKDTHLHAPLSAITGPNERQTLPRARLSRESEKKATKKVAKKASPKTKTPPKETPVVVNREADNVMPGDVGLEQNEVGKLAPFVESAASDEVPALEPVSETPPAVTSPFEVSPAETSPGTMVSTPSPAASRVEPLNEAEIRERLNKLSDEVRAKEKADQANIEPSNVGGLTP